MKSDTAQIRLKSTTAEESRFPKQSILLRVHNGQTTQSITRVLNTKSLPEGEVLLTVDFFDNFADNYTLLVSADGYRDAGFFPVKVSQQSVINVSLMLIPDDPHLQFDDWDRLNSDHSPIAKFLSLSAGNDPKSNYDSQVEDKPKETACLLNLATAMSQIFLANGTPLDYFRGIEWDTLAVDRFFGFAIPDLVSEVKRMVAKKLFAPELDPGFFHGDATSSFKEIRFGEANVQLTFHENDKKKINEELCVRVEPDIDYYKDLGAHALLEVFYNKLTNSLTDPAQVYVLRWMAGKQAGVPEFNPPYRLTE